MSRIPRYLPKFLTKNKITSTSMITASSGQANVLRLIDGNTSTKWYTINQKSGSRTITINFGTAQTINRLYFQGINWKDFSVVYNAGTFSPNVSIVGNTETDLYIEVTSVSATTITITITDTITASQEVSCGELYCGEEIFEMEASSAGKYKIVPDVSQKLFEMSDGTVYKVFVRYVTSFEIELENVSTAERLRYVSLYQRNYREPFVFIPNPVQPSAMSGITLPLTFTSTFEVDATTNGTWDGVACRVSWVNAFDLDNHVDDISDNPYTGVIKLKQASGI